MPNIRILAQVVLKVLCRQGFSIAIMARAITLVKKQSSMTMAGFSLGFLKQESHGHFLEMRSLYGII